MDNVFGRSTCDNGNSLLGQQFQMSRGRINIVLGDRGACKRKDGECERNIVCFVFLEVPQRLSGYYSSIAGFYSLEPFCLRLWA